MNNARLHVFTGKGGVGKTAFALSYALHLKDQGLDVAYICFDQIPASHLTQKLGLNEIQLSVEASALKYMEKKLGSKIIAGWIAKTPFFRALYDMVPSFGQMILLGHLIDMLQQNPKLKLVLDSPSSGHALTLFEAAQNFREIFKSGLLVNDINRMLKFLADPENLCTTIITLPTLMALQEGVELQEKLDRLDIGKTRIWLNDSLNLQEEIAQYQEELPDFLRVKMENEKEAMINYQESISASFARFFTSELLDTVQALKKSLKEKNL
jgi:anion-transporting  ArsA/GET3 family ATPase